jgi:hypothetical protein
MVEYRDSIDLVERFPDGVETPVRKQVDMEIHHG